MMGLGRCIDEQVRVKLQIILKEMDQAWDPYLFLMDQAWDPSAGSNRPEFGHFDAW